MKFIIDCLLRSNIYSCKSHQSLSPKGRLLKGFGGNGWKFNLNNSMKRFLFFSVLVVWLLPPFIANSYCHDRGGVPNTGFCTRDPDYHGGAYVCLPGGFTCDGDDIF